MEIQSIGLNFYNLFNIFLINKFQKQNCQFYATPLKRTNYVITIASKASSGIPVIFIPDKSSMEA